MNEIERKLDYTEKMFLKYGAKPAFPENDEKNQAFGLRRSFEKDGVYFRVETADFEEGSLIVITATDNPKFANVGIGDNIAGFDTSYSDERIEKEVRFALGIEPYPETYPVYDV